MYLIYMNKEDFALKNQEVLICQTKSYIFLIYMYKEFFGIKLPLKVDTP